MAVAQWKKRFDSIPMHFSGYSVHKPTQRRRRWQNMPIIPPYKPETTGPEPEYSPRQLNNECPKTGAAQALPKVSDTKVPDEVVSQLQTKVDKQETQIVQLQQDIDMLTQTVDKGFECFDMKLEDWVSRLRQFMGEHVMEEQEAVLDPTLMNMDVSDFLLGG
ncbi:hypothetical protein TruAng_012309 [Truncatella angustata]|nr:hypothetical protein TruAng_012309 [Truncatella angustata]